MPILPALIRGWENLIIFTAYYFSTPTLVNTLFAPWHRYVWKPQKRGLHLDELFFVVASNLLSRTIGVLIRLPAIAAGVLAISLTMVAGPPIVLLTRLVYPHAALFDIRKLFIVRPLAYDWHFGYTPLLDTYATELYNTSLPLHLIGREQEIADIRRTLHQEFEKNILLVGDSGSGRHALISYLARFEPARRFMLFNLVPLLKDKQTPAEEAGSLEEVLQDAAGAGNVVLVVDHVEQLLPFTNVLVPFLESNELTIVGITTSTTYHKDMLPNESLMKYFYTVEIAELTKEQVLAIIQDKLISFYNLKLPDPLVVKLHESSYQLQTLERKHQPEAALHLIDEFVAFHREQPAKDKNADLPVQLDTFLKLRLKIPTGSVASVEKETLMHLEEQLKTRIIAQPEAMSEIANALIRRRLNLGNKNKPIGSFLFLGPTGVGKTETAKALSDIFFRDRKLLTRFDMARYKQTAPMLFFQDELAKAVRQHPYGVLLLDEIEKADAAILNLLLTIIDEGYFQDTTNAIITCNNLIIIATSNAGAQFIRESQPTATQLIDYVLRYGLFTPELVNRFDAVIMYKPLTADSAKSIARIKLTYLAAQLEKEHNQTLAITDALIDHIVAEGTHPDFGAREIDRTIQRVVENKLAKELLMDKTTI